MTAPANRSWRDDLVLVRRAVLVFAGALLAAAGATMASNHAAAEQADRLTKATRAHQRALSRLRNVALEQQDIALYQPRFLALRQAGLIGGENRLAWVEAVRTVQAQRKLPSVSYEIEPQQVVTMDRQLDLADYRLRASRMQLHMGLAHELDLFAVLDALQRAGLFSVEDCKLRRVALQLDAASSAGVQSECTVVGLSLGAKGGH
ncbi:MAG: hypothetical protein ABIT83_03555 [Massilia sp.]